MKNMQSEYGPDKGKSVFYASKNAGKISGVDDTYPRANTSEMGRSIEPQVQQLRQQADWAEKDGNSTEARKLREKARKLEQGEDAELGHLAVGTKGAQDAMPLRFACDGVATRTAQIVGRIGEFVLLEGMALDSGFYFTQGPGGPRKFTVRQEALDYIEYAMDAESGISELVAELQALEKAKKWDQVEAKKREIVAYKKHRNEKLSGKDAELFPGSSKPDPARAEMYRQANTHEALKAKQEMNAGRQPTRSNMSRSDLEGMDAEEFKGPYKGFSVGDRVKIREGGEGVIESLSDNGAQIKGRGWWNYGDLWKGSRPKAPGSASEFGKKGFAPGK